MNKFPPDGDLNEYDGTILHLIASTVVNLNVDYRVTELFGNKHKSCSFDVRKKLQTVAFAPSSQLKKIQDYSFYNCSVLESINIEQCKDLETIGSFTFANCTSLTTINFPTDKLSTIGESAFCQSGLTSIFIPSCVQTIGYMMTSDCLDLATYEFDAESQVTVLPHFTFYNTKVTSFVMPKNIATIEIGAFERALKLDSITVAAGNNAFAINGEGLMDIGKTIFYFYPATKTGMYTIPPNTVRIENTALIYTKLTEIAIPSSVETIGEWAFAKSSIKKISFSKGLLSIGEKAFFKCSELIDFELPDGLTEIGEEAFRYCQFSNITIPNTVNVIGDACFLDNPKLMKVFVPENITDFGGSSIPENPGTDIKFHPNSSIMITDDKIIMDKNKTFIFQYRGTQENFICNVPATIRIIKQDSFFNKENLIEVIFPPESILEKIEWQAFYKCTNLKDINLPSTIKKIEYA